MEIFPHPTTDRRLLPNIPSKHSTRRGTAHRFFCNTTIRVLSKGGKKADIFEGEGVDVSDNGVAIYTPRLLELGAPVSLRFFLPPGMLPEGYESGLSLDATVVRADAEKQLLAFQFKRNISEELRRRRWKKLILLSIIGTIIVLLGILYTKLESVYYFWFDVPLFVYGLMASIFLVSRFLFAAFYKGHPVDEKYTPSVSIIVPCFNEEQWIGKTIKCALDQYYPEDLLEVIVVDDGSSDNSVAVLHDLQEKYAPLVGDRLQVHAFAHNQGKRHALAEGTRRAKGELIIFVDSDSFLAPTAVLEIVQPLKDPKIAASTGRCEVENKWTNALTKMQSVRYYLGFRIFKGAESIFNSVTCLSGPLTCYRKSVVMQYLDAWINQKFFGKPATFGDDRSLTNYILRHHHTVYQHNAVCTTIVPSKYAVFYKQQMRWKRSWLRESLRCLFFIWRKEPFMSVSFLVGFLLPVMSPFVVARAFIYIPFEYSVFPFVYLLGVFLMSMMMSTVYLFAKRSTLWFYGSIFCYFYLFILLWQMIPAMFTFWVSDWGTRSAKQKPASQ
jgi:hyaluronan synthase